MRLEDITADMLARAVDIYIKAAYASATTPIVVKNRVLFVKENTSADARELLAREPFERIPSEEDEDLTDVYSLRLGNAKYPHMKLALRRVEGDDYVLVVEPHDEHFEVESADRDAPRAQELKDFNRKLKQDIESAWHEADLPVPEDE